MTRHKQETRLCIFLFFLQRVFASVSKGVVSAERAVQINERRRIAKSKPNKITQLFPPILRMTALSKPPSLLNAMRIFVVVANTRNVHIHPLAWHAYFTRHPCSFQNHHMPREDSINHLVVNVPCSPTPNLSKTVRNPVVHEDTKEKNSTTRHRKKHQRQFQHQHQEKDNSSGSSNSK